MGRKSRKKRELREKEEVRPQREKPEIRPVAICRGIILLGTCLILFTPLIISGKFFFPFVGPKSIYFFALVEIIFAAYLFLILLKPGYRPRFNILLIAIILFIAILILSSFLGADLSRSFWSKYERMTGLLMWFHLLAFFIVISSVFRKKKDWFKIFGVSVFVAILMSVISLLIKIDVNALGGIGASTRGGATIGNSSFLGTYLLFNVFLALYLFIKSAGGLRIYSGISLAIISPALLVSDARAAIISVLGGVMLLFFLWLIFSKKGSLRLAGISLLLIFIIGVASLIFFAFQPDSFVYETLWVKVSTKGRLAVWETAWKGFKDHPWLGWGPENYELIHTKHFNSRLFLQEYGKEVWFDRAHNIIFDTLATSGIISLLSYLGIFISAFYVLWRKYFREKLDFWIPSFFSVILISYSVQNLTVFDMVSSYMMFFLILGLIGSIALKKEDYNSHTRAEPGGPSTTHTPPQVVPQRNISFLNPLIAIVILILFAFSFFKFVIQPIRADAHVIKAIQAQSSTERVSLYKKTLDISSLGKYQIREMFANSTINFTRSKAAETTSLEDFRLEFDFLSKELEKSIKESPLDFRAFLTLGKIYNIYSQIDPTKLSSAQRVLEKAVDLSPTNQQGYWALAQTRLYQQKFNEALSLAEKAVELEPRILQSHLIVIQVAKLMGEYDLVEQKAEEAIAIDPSWEPEIKEILEKQ